MELAEPKFMKTEFVYYDDDGLRIKDNAPEWVKNEYEEFMKSLDSGIQKD